MPRLRASIARMLRWAFMAVRWLVRSCSRTAIASKFIGPSRWIRRRLGAAGRAAVVRALVRSAVFDFRGRSLLLGGHGVGRFVQFGDFVALEINRDPTRIQMTATALPQVINVVPLFFVERVGDHRRTEQITHLAARHTGLGLISGRLIPKVAPLYVNAGDACRR